MSDSKKAYFYKSRHISAKEENRVETSRRIDKITYGNFALQQDPTTEQITRVSHSFIWDDYKPNVLLYVIESYLTLTKNFSILRINLEYKSDENFLENFKLFPIEKDVTG